MLDVFLFKSARIFLTLVLVQAKQLSATVALRLIPFSFIELNLYRPTDFLVRIFLCVSLALESFPYSISFFQVVVFIYCVFQFIFFFVILEAGESVVKSEISA